MKQLMIVNKQFKPFNEKYWITPKGRVFKNNGDELQYFKNPKSNSKGKFVRLFGNKKAISVGIAKIVLLTYNSKEYKKGKIAIHKNGNTEDNRIENLFWGSRKDQTEISMRNAIHSKRIMNMAKNFYKTNHKTKKIKDLLSNGKTQKQISKILKSKN